MKQILFFIPLFCLISPLLAVAHGHGGGHGGGSHGGGSHMHSSHSGTTHSGSSGFSNSGAGGTHSAGSAAARQRSVTRTIITRSTSPSAIAANHGRIINPNMTHVAATPAHRAQPVVPGGTAIPSPSEYYNGNPNITGSTYGYNNPYYYYYDPYYISPYNYYDPYYSMFSFGYGFMYTPNYMPVNSPNYANGANEEQLSRQPMDGFVVFYNDTLSGAVTVARKAISMETTDSGKDYDYHFREKDPGLQYVTVYNEDDKQLNMVRLKGDTKKLWRVIHTGKLNIYDTRRGFIYQPQDIDVKTLTVSYNGEIASLHSSSIPETKEWLTNYVNQAYNLSLDPKKFSWNQLLIYIDKLD